MRRVLFAMIALGALAWMAAPASAAHSGSYRGGNVCGPSQGGHNHGYQSRNSWRRILPWGNQFDRHRYDRGGSRYGDRGGSFRFRY